MMKTKHGGTKYVRYSEGYTIVHVCDTEVKLYCICLQSRNAIIYATGAQNGKCMNVRKNDPQNGQAVITTIENCNNVVTNMQ